MSHTVQCAHMKINEKLNIAYLAGVLDSKGHFYLCQHKNGRGEIRPQVRIVVVSTHKPIINWLQVNFGGSISTQKPKKNENKQIYRWTLSGKKAIELVLLVKSHIIAKQEQVRRVLF